MTRKVDITTKSVLFSAMLALVISTAHAQSEGASAQNASSLAAPISGDDTSVAPPTNGPVPQSPEQLKQMYAAQMVAVTDRFSAGIAAITDAVDRGELTPEQGQKNSAALYQLSVMQLELFQSWRDMLEPPQRQRPQPSVESTPSTDIISVDLPFSSLQFNPAVAEYLGVSTAQMEKINGLIDQQRQALSPLVLEARDISQKLVAASGHGASNSEINGLAKKQAAIVAKVIVAQARLQAQIYGLLNVQQQRKLDLLKDSTVLASK